MEQELKQVECPQPCCFTVRSHDQNEVLELVKNHAKRMHQKTVSDDEIKSMITTVKQPVASHP